jgi:hypothetical protein
MHKICMYTDYVHFAQEKILIVMHACRKVQYDRIFHKHLLSNMSINVYPEVGGDWNTLGIL